MPDRRRTTRALSQRVSGLTAAATVMTDPRALRVPIQNKNWQREGWDFWRSQGEFWYGTEWLSRAMSRVRLRAGILKPGSPEPEILSDGPAVEAVMRLGGGPGGHATIMKSLTVKLSVPGEGYVVGETVKGAENWSVKSADEIRRKQFDDRRATNETIRAMHQQSGQPSQSEYEIQIEEGAWRALDYNSVVCRVWQPDEQFSWRAMSAAQPAIPILRELDLYNRRIIADLVSRLASNGILIMPEEVTFPVRPEFKDSADPLVSEFIDIASKSIANPGSASAAIPIPLRVKAEYADKFIHLNFASLFDPKLLEARDSAIRRLATTMNIPMEVLMGIGSTNHWTAWQIDEAGIKIHIMPTAELICQALTIGYLQPILLAMGELHPKDGGRYVIWPDATELSSTPDLGDASDAAYDRMEISGEAYRRERGFNEEDKPSDEDLKDMTLKLMVAKGMNPEAAKELTGLDLAPPPPLGVNPDGTVIPGGPMDPNLKKEDPKDKEAKDPKQQGSAPAGGRSTPIIVNGAPGVPSGKTTLNADTDPFETFLRSKV